MNNRFVPSSNPIDNPDFNLDYCLASALFADKSFSGFSGNGISFSTSFLSVAYHFPTHSVIATF